MSSELVTAAIAAVQDVLVGDARLRRGHCRGAAAGAVRIAPQGADLDLLAAAGWVHDIGYGAAAQETGFHPIDGARWLAAHDWPPLICSLVAWHTCCHHEADLRGLADELNAWPRPPQPLLDALTWADLHSSPDGSYCTLTERLASIKARYQPDHVVPRAIAAAEDELHATCIRAETAAAVPLNCTELDLS